jgi:hypothetical protein
MKKLIALMAIVITVLLAGGCEKPQTTPSARDITPPSANRRTVQTLEAKPSDIQDLYTKWEQEHWKVLSTSKVTIRADGTKTRTVELFR